MTFRIHLCEWTNGVDQVKGGDTVVEPATGLGWGGRDDTVTDDAARDSDRVSSQSERTKPNNPSRNASNNLQSDVDEK